MSRFLTILMLVIVSFFCVLPSAAQTFEDRIKNGKDGAIRSDLSIARSLVIFDQKIAKIDRFAAKSSKEEAMFDEVDSLREEIINAINDLLRQKRLLEDHDKELILRQVSELRKKEAEVSSRKSR